MKYLTIRFIILFLIKDCATREVNKFFNNGVKYFETMFDYCYGINNTGDTYGSLAYLHENFLHIYEESKFCHSTLTNKLYRLDYLLPNNYVTVQLGNDIQTYIRRCHTQTHDLVKRIKEHGSSDIDIVRTKRHNGIVQASSKSKKSKSNQDTQLNSLYDIPINSTIRTIVNSLSLTQDCNFTTAYVKQMNRTDRCLQMNEEYKLEIQRLSKQHGCPTTQIFDCGPMVMQNNRYIQENFDLRTKIATDYYNSSIQLDYLLLYIDSRMVANRYLDNFNDCEESKRGISVDYEELVETNRLAESEVLRLTDKSVRCGTNLTFLQDDYAKLDNILTTFVVKAEALLGINPSSNPLSEEHFNFIYRRIEEDVNLKINMATRLLEVQREHDAANSTNIQCIKNYADCNDTLTTVQSTYSFLSANNAKLQQAFHQKEQQLELEKINLKRCTDKATQSQLNANSLPGAFVAAKCAEILLEIRSIFGGVKRIQVSYCTEEGVTALPNEFIKTNLLGRTVTTRLGNFGVNED